MNIFDQCDFYCMNLDTRPDRWEKVQEQFSLLNLENVVRYSAKTDVPIRNKKLRKSEHSIIETNLELLRTCDRSKYITIFQDDVYFLMEYNPLEIMNKVTEQLPKDFGILYLGAYLFDRKIKHSLVAPNLVKLQPEPRPTPRKDHVYLGGAHAIIFSQQSIEFILSQSEDILFEAQWDVFLSKHVIAKFSSYMAYPIFAHQTEDFSDNAGKYIKRGWMIKRNQRGIQKGEIPDSLIKRIWQKAF